MIINNVKIVGKEEGSSYSIQIDDKGKCSVGLYDDIDFKKKAIKFDNAIAFPGMINSHDHLDFNCFPRIGNRVYQNYREWGLDIHQHNQQLIKEVLKIPQELRIQWGIYKNLLNGFTTVVNHGDRLKIQEPLIDVYEYNCSLHSVGFEKYWKWKLNSRIFNGKKIDIHIGEGTDKISSSEIDSLIRWNLFKQSLVGVHGVAMDSRQAAHFEALVWCPVSNFFLLDKTANIDQIKMATAILFGTDSTLTSEWNLWNHLRMARATKTLTDDELFNSVTETPKDIWRLNKNTSDNNYLPQDWVIAKNKLPNNTMDAFFALDPEDILMIIRNGRIVFFDETLHGDILKLGIDIDKRMSQFSFNGIQKNIQGDLPALIQKIRKFYPADKMTTNFNFK